MGVGVGAIVALMLGVCAPVGVGDNEVDEDVDWDPVDDMVPEPLGVAVSLGEPDGEDDMEPEPLGVIVSLGVMVEERVVDVVPEPLGVVVSLGVTVAV